MLAARERGLDRIGVARASMAALPHPDGAFDLLWAEGSAYMLGVDAALAEWRRLLRPSGVLVLTEVGWTTDAPSAAAREFWAASYPGMRSPAATAAAARSALARRRPRGARGTGRPPRGDRAAPVALRRLRPHRVRPAPSLRLGQTAAATVASFSRRLAMAIGT